jgi:hypothetical protein
VEGTILSYLKGFGTPFLLLPAVWSFIVAKRDAFWLPLYQTAVGGLSFFFFSLSLNIHWNVPTEPWIFPVLVAFAYFCLLAFYSLFLFGGITVYDAKWPWGREKFFDYVNKTIYKYILPQQAVLGLTFVLLLWCAGKTGLQQLNRVSILMIGLLALTALVTYALDRNRAADIRRHFVMERLAGRKFKKGTTLFIAGTMLVLGTIFEWPRGMWLAWLAHAFFIVVWLLIHFRYWRSVYG